MVSRIPYAKKVNYAEELAMKAGVLDEEAGVCYWSYLYDAISAFIMMKAYTDADMAEYEDVEGLYRLMDEDISAVEKIAMDDWGVVADLAGQMFENMKRVWNAEHSLGNKIMKSFAFLFDGRDLTETMAQARDVNEQMIDHLKKIGEADKAPVDITKYAKKNK